MSKIAKRVLAIAVALVTVFAIGNLSGLYFYPKFFVNTESIDDHDHADNEEHEHEEHEHEEDDHIALTKQAFENLGLELGNIRRSGYWKNRTVPGEVVEIPGKSDRSVPAPVAGVVETVMIRQGQSLGLSETLLTLRVTDASLTQAQSQLLSTLARQEVVRAEIDRLQPLTSSGTVSGRAKRDLEYELKQLVADQNTKVQEIRAHGLPDSVVNSIVRERQLADKLTITLPEYSSDSPTRHVSISSKPRHYSVEQLNVHPGKSVERGDSLCSLAFHSELYIEGTAFEDDLPVLKAASGNDWPINAEFGHSQNAGHSHSTKRGDLKLLHVDNHVDRESQTVKFYLSLSNEVEQSVASADGRTFLQWRFRPGQRVHLKVPESYWEDQLLLPVDAVVVEGPNAVVFVEHHHDDESASHSDEADEIHEHEDDHEEVFMELEPVPVRLLHRDSEFAVIADDGQLHDEDRIALNNAFKLQLALKMQAGGGGGHHHDHDH